MSRAPAPPSPGRDPAPKAGRDRRLLLGSALGALVLLAAGGAWLAASRDADPFAPCRTTAVAGGLDQFGGPFTLTAEDGSRMTDAQVFDRPTLLYFGYTFCPDVCPLDNARNGVAADLLKEKGHALRPVFISVDPKRDTPERLRDFTDAMHPDLLGLTGTPAEIAAVAKQWKTYYKAHDETGDPYYLVDHMTNTYLVLPGGKAVEFFDRAATPEQIAERAACYIDRARV